VNARESVPFLQLTAADEASQVEIEAALLRVARSGRYLLGEELARFEAQYAGMSEAQVDYVAGAVRRCA
jgi:hypothetical protein